MNAAPAEVIATAQNAESQDAGQFPVPAMMSEHATSGTSPTQRSTSAMQDVVLVYVDDEQSVPAATYSARHRASS